MSTQDDLRAELAQQAANLQTMAANAPERQKTIFEMLMDPQQQAQLAKALPGAMDPERFARVTLTAIRANPTLQQCTATSLMAACMQAAQLGLEPGVLGHSYLVPFRTKRGYDVQLIIGYQGYVELFYRSERVTSIVAREVCENDEWSFSYGLTDEIVHRPALRDRGEPILYYGLARLTNGDHVLHVINLDEIAARRNRSKAKDSGPWVTDPVAMSKKTTIRAMVPLLPKTATIAAAFIADESVPTKIHADMANELAALPYIETTGEESREESTTEAPTTSEEEAQPPADDTPAAEEPPADDTTKEPSRSRRGRKTEEPTADAEQCPTCGCPAPFHEDGCPEAPEDQSSS